MADERFVLHHEGRWFYYFGSIYGKRPLGDGEPMHEAELQGWWWMYHKPEVIEIERPGGEDIDHYILDGNVPPTDAFPQRISLQTWRERVLDEEDERVRALYGPVHVKRDPEFERVDAEWVELEGSPGPTPRNWEAKLPWALRYAHEYRHLFPGRLTGFHKALKDRLNEIPGVSAYDHRPFAVFVETEYDPPRYKKSHTKKKKPERKLRQLKIRPPDSIPGDNVDDAIAEWDRQMERYVGEVRQAAHVKVCGHCDGDGVVWADREEASV